MRYLFILILFTSCFQHKFNKAYRGEMLGVVLSDLGGSDLVSGNSSADYVHFIRLDNGRYMALYSDTTLNFTKMRYNIRMPKDTQNVTLGYRQEWIDKYGELPPHPRSVLPKN